MPIWLTLSSSPLHDFSSMARWMRFGLVHSRSSPMICAARGAERGRNDGKTQVIRAGRCRDILIAGCASGWCTAGQHLWSGGRERPKGERRGRQDVWLALFDIDTHSGQTLLCTYVRLRPGKDGPWIIGSISRKSRKQTQSTAFHAAPPVNGRHEVPNLQSSRLELHSYKCNVYVVMYASPPRTPCQSAW